MRANSKGYSSLEIFTSIKNLAKFITAGNYDDNTLILKDISKP